MNAPVTLEVVAQRLLRTAVPVGIAFAFAMIVFAIWGPAYAAVDPNAGSPKIIDIQDSPGGNVAEFYENYQKLSKEGVTIRLHGYCASACTLILLREFTGIKACAVDDDPG